MEQKKFFKLVTILLFIYLLFCTIGFIVLDNKISNIKSVNTTRIVVMPSLSTPTPTPSPTSTPVPATPTPEPVVETLKFYKEEIVGLMSITEDGALWLDQTPPQPWVEPYDPVSSIYSVFTEAELNLLYHVVEAETYGNHYEEHLHVANVIFNRLRSGEWGTTLTEILTSPYQFMVVTNGFYKRVKVSMETIQAVEDAWLKDYTYGAIFFDSTNGKSWAAKNRTFLFRDGAGHDFYK